MSIRVDGRRPEITTRTSPSQESKDIRHGPCLIGTGNGTANEMGTFPSTPDRTIKVEESFSVMWMMAIQSKLNGRINAFKTLAASSLSLHTPPLSAPLPSLLTLA